MFQLYLYTPTQDDFDNACQHGKLQRAMKILHANPRIEVSEYIFNRVCEKGYVEIAQWLYSIMLIKPPIDIPFLLASGSHHLPVVKWLYSITPMTVYVMSSAFKIACINEDIEMAKWIYFTNEKVIILVDIQELFEMACIYDNLELTQWLYSIRPANSLETLEIENAFHWACINGNLQIAKWLYTLYPQVNLQFSKKYYYHRHRRNSNTDKMGEVAKWLSSLQSDNINILTDLCTTIIASRH